MLVLYVNRRLTILNSNSSIRNISVKATIDIPVIFKNLGIYTLHHHHLLQIHLESDMSGLSLILHIYIQVHPYHS